MAKGDEVQIINPPNLIAQKVTKGGPNAVTAADLEGADQRVARNFGNQYVEWLAEDIEKLETALNDITAAGEGAQEEAIENFKELAHEMRGFGGTFDYNLITAISDQLFRVMEQFDGINAQQAMIIKLHIDSMKVVSTERIKGDGGERGVQVMTGLQSVVAKFT